MQPKHKFLFNIFSLPSVFIMLFIWAAGVYAVLKIHGEIVDPAILFLIALPTFLPMAKLELGMSFLQGHGVHQGKKIFGFPILLFAILAVLFILVLLICWSSYIVSQGFPGDRLRGMSFSTSFFFSLVLMSARWRFNLFYRYWTASEYEVVARMKARGATVEEIQQRLAYLRSEGWLETDIPVPNLESVPNGNNYLVCIEEVFCVYLLSIDLVDSSTLVDAVRGETSKPRQQWWGFSKSHCFGPPGRNIGQILFIFYCIHTMKR